MTKSPINNDDLENSDQHHCSTWEKPNLKGDRMNLFVLIVLYTLQGTTYGFTMALTIIFQNKKMVTYTDLGSFSFVFWPFSMKLLWAPLVDSFYSHRMGRRKSWFIPAEYLIGILCFYFSYNVDDWLPESEKPNIQMIAYVMFVMNFLSATQDIAVDGWTLLKKNNVSYGSTCNNTGIALGILIGMCFPILFSSKNFCNKFLRFTPGIGGIINIKTFLICYGFVCLVSTTLIGIFKEEKDERSQDDHIGYITTESVTNLKLIDAGVSKNDITIINSSMQILKVFVPFVIAKYTSGPRPISLYLKLTPLRLIWSTVFAELIYYTPLIIKSNNNVVNVPLYYYFIIGVIFAINEILSSIMVIVMISFFTRISDPRFGGTYMTLLNTVRNLGWSVSYTTIIMMVDILTFEKCSNDLQNSCSTEHLEKICHISGGNCAMIVDGYYIEVLICLVIGFIWYFVCKSLLKNLQLRNRSQWMVNLN